MALRKRAVASSVSPSVMSSDDKNACKRNTFSGGATQNENITSLAANKNHNDEGEQDELSFRNLLPAIMVSSLVSVGSYYSCDSIDLAEDVVVATVRTFVQLGLLAALLSPLFRFVEDQPIEIVAKREIPKRQMKVNAFYNNFWSNVKKPFLVLAYVFCFMLPLAAYEASSRSKLTLRPTSPSSLPFENIVLPIVSFSLFTAVSTMGAIAIFAIIKPVPRYSPRHVIPLCGMLFNNALSSISLALDILFTELQSNQRGSIELMISFGADPWMATRPSFRSVLASSLRPQINSMNVIGLVAIPGMMTGQVLSGSSPIRAARYQIIIMCLILGASFIAVGMTIELVIWNAFDERGALRDDWVVDNDSLRVSQLISSFAVSSTVLVQSGRNRSGGSKSHLQDLERADTLGVTTVELSAKDPTVVKPGSTPFFQVSFDGLFAKGTRRMVAQMTIPTDGNIAILQGPSGIGKSTALKAIAELNSGFISSLTSSTAISLSGRDRTLFHPSEWRQHVLYLPQTGPSILEGTPNSFIAFISSSAHQKHSSKPTTIDLLTSRTKNYIEAWGVQQSKLSLPWAKLSGGESQRVLLAIALATGPKLLLMDESTAALDLESKLKVEESLKRSAANGCAMVLVTHDDDQIDRLGTMLMSLGEISR